MLSNPYSEYGSHRNWPQRSGLSSHTAPRDSFSASLHAHMLALWRIIVHFEREEQDMALRKTASPAVKLDSLSDVNDLGKPWRFTDEDTGLTVTRSCVWSPPGCHPVGCGLKLYTDENGRLVKVEGDENHPVTQGAPLRTLHCAEGLRVQQLPHSASDEA